MRKIVLSILIFAGMIAGFINLYYHDYVGATMGIGGSLGILIMILSLGIKWI